MKIELKINSNTYYIQTDVGCYVISRLETSTNPESKDYGIEKEKSLGLYPMTVAQAVNKIIRVEHYDDKSIVTLQEYAEKIDAVKESIREQLLAYEL